MIFPKKLKKDEINALPLKYYQGKIHLISSQDRSIEVCKNLINESVLGFDTETRPAFRKGEHYLPSLVQLAGENAVFIFQLEKTGMESLKQILSNKNIIKCGVAINYDLIELNRISPFIPNGFIDLGDVARKANIPHHGLRGLAAYLLKIRISKSAQTTNWNANKLSQKQISYAATDAWIGRKLYLDHFNKINSQRF